MARLHGGITDKPGEKSPGKLSKQINYRLENTMKANTTNKAKTPLDHAYTASIPYGQLTKRKISKQEAVDLSKWARRPLIWGGDLIGAEYI